MEALLEKIKIKTSEVKTKATKKLTQNLGGQGELPDNHGGLNGLDHQIPGITTVSAMYLVFQSNSN